MPIITLTTDFGLHDAYVGAMKGVLLSVCPDLQIVDITHLLPPQDLQTAALLLPDVVPYYPAGSVHVVVVDPGVGSDRRGMVMRLDFADGPRWLVGPDNGVFTVVLDRAQSFDAVALTEPRFWRNPPSSTFHGRDIFAPVAAHLACGVELGAFGPSLADPLRLAFAMPQPTPTGGLTGNILTIDHFGNCVSNISVADLTAYGLLETLTVKIGTQQLQGVLRTYSEAASGAALALIGSSGYLEVAIRDGNAAQVLGISRGMPLTIER
jgi:S-adenosylmethionine hydrolase